jgi:hypothetical protein
MAMSVLLRRMKVPATVHGMRSSARSWMADNGVEFELAEAHGNEGAGRAIHLDGARPRRFLHVENRACYRVGGAASRDGFDDRIICHDHTAVVEKRD